MAPGKSRRRQGRSVVFKREEVQKVVQKIRKSLVVFSAGVSHRVFK